MTAAKNQKRHPLPRLGVFGQPELPATQAAPGRVRWAALTVLLAVCLVCYNYTDLPLIVRHSISFWDALRTGRLNQFYQLATALPIGQATGQTGEVPYDIWVYVLLAVWNLPVYLWELATGLTFETNLIAMVWVRLVGMLPFVGANWAILGIARQLGRPKEQGLWACWGFSTSLFLLNGLFCIGQIDIFNVFFTLMGLWAWLKKDERGFIGWFALAVTFKMFALMVFLPLLLLEEKRLWRIAGASAGACSLSLLSKLLFLRDKMNTPTQFDERRFIRFLFGRNLDLGGATISAFVLLFGATVLVCWLSRMDEQARPAWALWAMLAGYGSFFIGAAAYPYWAVVLAPCAALALLVWPGYAKQTVLLEAAAGAAYFGCSVLTYTAVYSGEMNLRWMLAGRLKPWSREGDALVNLLGRLSEGALQNTDALLMAVLVLAVGGMLVLYAPWRASRPQREGSLAVDGGTLWARFALSAAVALAPLLLYLVG